MWFVSWENAKTFILCNICCDCLIKHFWQFFTNYSFFFFCSWTKKNVVSIKILLKEMSAECVHSTWSLFFFTYITFSIHHNDKSIFLNSSTHRKTNLFYCEHFILNSKVQQYNNVKCVSLNLYYFQELFPHQDLVHGGLVLTRKFLNQWFFVRKLNSSLQKP